MRLTANKPCNFGGRKFLIGEEIPVELVANPKAQEKMGVISIADGETIPTDVTAKVGVVKFEIPIHTDNGDILLSVTNEELNVFTEIRQIGVSSTEDKQKLSALIQNVESEDLLILLDALDGRKHVKEEAQARAQELESIKNPEGQNVGGDE